MCYIMFKTTPTKRAGVFVTYTTHKPPRPIPCLCSIADTYWKVYLWEYKICNIETYIWHKHRIALCVCQTHNMSKKNGRFLNITLTEHDVWNGVEDQDYNDAVFLFFIIDILKFHKNIIKSLRSEVLHCKILILIILFKKVLLVL